VSARDDYPALSALSELLPDRAGGEQAQEALDEIDRLRSDIEVLIGGQLLGEALGMVQP
jgi:hypothetical protein